MQFVSENSLPLLHNGHIGVWNPKSLPKNKYLTQSLNKRHRYHTMVWEFSMVQVAHVGLYQAQLTHIPYRGHWGPWWGSGGVQSQTQKIEHFWTSFPVFPGSKILRYLWVNWNLVDPQKGFGVVLHINVWSIAILSRPYPKRASYSSIWRPKFMENF